MKRLVIYVIIILIIAPIKSQTISEWRGKNRTGIYDESGLLKKWPEDGPEILWINDSLPDGYSSVSVADNKIFLTGIIDSSEYLLALDIRGNKLWQTKFGRAWDGSFPQSRATPTIENKKIFISSGKGDLACINAINGEIIWEVKASENYSGALGRWGLAESLLVNDNLVFFTVGGDLTCMIALNKNTGQLVWKSESLNDEASYTSPILIERKGKKQIINVTKDYIFGIDPKTGKIIWKFDFGKFKKERNNNTNTPLYFDGGIYLTSGYDHKSVKLQINEDLSIVSHEWTDSILDTHHGGVVKVGNYIYGSNWENNNMGSWVCLDWYTGKLQYITKWRNKGSIISAEGMLYCFEEKTGYVALVKATPKEFKIISEFKVDKGNGPYWAHPVINNGILYIRHGKALIAYNIKEK